MMSDDTKSTLTTLEIGSFDRGGQGILIELSMTLEQVDLMCGEIDYVSNRSDPADHSRL